MHASGLGHAHSTVELASCRWEALHAALFDTLGTKTDRLTCDCGTCGTGMTSCLLSTLLLRMVPVGLRTDLPGPTPDLSASPLVL